jgi:hypothetical protein
MPQTMTQPSLTPEAAADPKDALAHFERLLSFETDCWDVHAAMSAGKCEFVLLDVRSPQALKQRKCSAESRAGETPASTSHRPNLLS